MIICVLCLVAGASATARWLPELALGVEGGMAFCAICGLLGMALAVVGLHVYLIVETFETRDSFASGLLASDLTTMFWETGALVGFALIVFLLAPLADEPEQRPLTETIDTAA